MLFRYFLVGTLLLFTLGTARACDACGCSMSPSYTALMPGLGGHLVGFWWQHQRYRSFAATDLAGTQSAQPEYFNTLEIRTRWQLASRWHLTAILPYAYHLRQHEGKPRKLTGIGDAIALLQWAAIDHNGQSGRQLYHRLAIGLGGKMPTGRFQAPTPNELVNPNFQVGTGSWDALGNLNYTLRWKDWGLSLDGTYRHNGQGPHEYRFGNRFSGIANAFVFKRYGEVELMPNAGLYIEQAQQDTELGYYRTHTGGQAWLANAGMELFWQSFNLGFSYSLPVQQEWNVGLVEALPRFSMHLNHFF